MVNTKSNDMIDFSASVRNFAERKICLQPQRLQIHLSNAKEVLNAGLQHFLGGDYKWQPEYDKVADWLTDNKGLGLFCMGNCGRGKDHHLFADTSMHHATLSSQNYGNVFGA